MTPTPLQRNEKVLDSFCKENEGKVLWATNSVLKNKLKELFDSVLATQRQEVLARVVENGDIVTLNKEGNCHLCGRKVGVTYWPTPPETSSWREDFESTKKRFLSNIEIGTDGLHIIDTGLFKALVSRVASSEYNRGKLEGEIIGYEKAIDKLKNIYTYD